MCECKQTARPKSHSGKTSKAMTLMYFSSAECWPMGRGVFCNAALFLTVTLQRVITVLLTVMQITALAMPWITRDDLDQQREDCAPLHMICSDGSSSRKHADLQLTILPSFPQLTPCTQVPKPTSTSKHVSICPPDPCFPLHRLSRAASFSLFLFLPLLYSVSILQAPTCAFLPRALSYPSSCPFQFRFIPLAKLSIPTQ